MQPRPAAGFGISGVGSRGGTEQRRGSNQRPPWDLPMVTPRRREATPPTANTALRHRPRLPPRGLPLSGPAPAAARPRPPPLTPPSATDPASPHGARPCRVPPPPPDPCRVRVMCPDKMAALRVAVLVLLGLCLGCAAAAVPLVIWHGMGEPGPAMEGGADPPVTALWAGRRVLAGPARWRGRAGTRAGPRGAGRPLPAPLR